MCKHFYESYEFGGINDILSESDHSDWIRSCALLLSCSLPSLTRDSFKTPHCVSVALPLRFFAVLLVHFEHAHGDHVPGGAVVRKDALLCSERDIGDFSEILSQESAQAPL